MTEAVTEAYVTKAVTKAYVTDVEYYVMIGASCFGGLLLVAAIVCILYLLLTRNSQKGLFVKLMKNKSNDASKPAKQEQHDNINTVTDQLQPDGKLYAIVAPSVKDNPRPAKIVGQPPTEYMSVQFRTKTNRSGEDSDSD